MYVICIRLCGNRSGWIRMRMECILERVSPKAARGVLNTDGFCGEMRKVGCRRQFVVTEGEGRAGRGGDNFKMRDGWALCLIAS